MDEKKATTKAAQKTENHPNNLTQPLLPKSQRELRLLCALVSGAVMRYELDSVIGAQNSPEYVSRLRMAGWEISTDRIPMIDRDGKKIKVGRYHLSVAHQALACEFLSKGG
ncbi:helix-turn-helix domain-containing protein [uncultured Thiothrix sp.]|uniref:helix-turn-helix domain-containing protein n=1 Tax=uncultured Thiothrix sp. TaxID=223185 RepID=UPI002603BE54|nr:helix-turn-helix domain-containing protein [uncultured Thiothrix sp.]HMT91990.1 helix-turn-helix domain-containing protein [Thiolinea sp.]